MQIDLFKIPVWIGNIQSEKINIKYSTLEKPWQYCSANSSFDSENFLDQESSMYLLNTINELIKPYFKIAYKIDLLNVWVNEYKNQDFQEPHIHTNSTLSFIVYKKVDEASTVFNNPFRYFIDYSGMSDYMDKHFEPSCRQNQIIIFPSFLEHFVKNNSNSITISGNLKITTIK